MAITTLSTDFSVVRSGDFYILNNVWGKGSLINGLQFTQSVSVDIASVTDSLNFKWNWPTGDGTTIVSYPEVGWGSSPRYDGFEECHDYVSKVSELGTFSVDLDVDVQAGSVYRNVSFDLWLTETPLDGGAAINSEVMVWLDKNDVEPWGTKIGTLGTGDDKASIYSVLAGRVLAWDYIAVVYDKPHLEGTIDLKAILTKLASRGYIEADDYISGYDFGAEISGGKGSFDIKKLDTTFETWTRMADIIKTGGSGSDTLTGLNGNDTLRGAAGNDSITGGASRDIITGGPGADKLNGGSGLDTVEYRTSNTAVYIDLAKQYASGGHASGDVLMNFENVVGSEFKDVLTGSRLTNVLTGLGGSDVIKAGGGNDTIYGDNGDDFIYGGTGADKITGGYGIDQMRGDAGADVFSFQAGHSTMKQVDIIRDFSLRDGDTIDLSGIDANILAANFQHFKFIGEAEFSGASGEVRVVKTGSDTFIYADTNSNSYADLAIRLDGAMDLTASAFLL